MKRSLFFISALAAALGGVTAAAAMPEDKAAPAEASIPFADSTGIRDWRGEGDQTVYVQAINRDWYKATLFAPAPDLPFVQALGFETRGTSSFDRFSSIVIGGQTYPLQSLVKIEGDPPKDAHKGKAVDHAHHEQSS